jgi:hypothetical protein
MEFGLLQLTILPGGRRDGTCSKTPMLFNRIASNSDFQAEVRGRHGLTSKRGILMGMDEQTRFRQRIRWGTRGRSFGKNRG